METTFSFKRNKARVIRFGHSPDPDDAYMFWGIAKNRIPLNGIRIQNYLSDIATLNQKARKSELEATAISVASYPQIADKYWIMTVGASVGRNYGPILIALKKWTPRKVNGQYDLTGKTIAVPGKNTTAYLLLNLFCSGFKPVTIPFDQVFHAVKSGKADMGLVIHEGQLTHAKEKTALILDMGKIWHREKKLPLPLGIDVIRKDLGLPTAKKITRILHRSIRAAQKNPQEALTYALGFGRGINSKVGKKFVSMYVNHDTIRLNAQGKKAIRLIIAESCRQNGIRDKINWNDTFISPQ